MFLLTIILLSSFGSGTSEYLNYASAQESEDKEDEEEEEDEGQQPIINDPNLKTEVVVNGLELPTGMAFLGPNDILVLEKDKGTVQRIIDGKILPEPLLDVNVANKNERGMLGIAVVNKNNNNNNNNDNNNKNGPTNTVKPTYVFLYYTE